MKITTTLLALIIGISVFAQVSPTQRNAVEVQHAIEKLRTVGSVLYIAAHTDDEHTRMITYFANERKLNTAYHSSPAATVDKTASDPKSANSWV